jgi:hypothetical protein
LGGQVKEADGVNIPVATEAIVEELTLEEGRQMLNGLTRDRLGIGVDEFLQNLEAGEYDESEDETILKLRMLVPFAA